jgi:hypothetical protein
VRTGEGITVGTASMVGVPRGAESARHLLPLPEGAVEKGGIALRLTVQGPGMPARPPHPGEVQELRLVYVPLSR